jgi:RNA recognition motif-containing protein
MSASQDGSVKIYFIVDTEKNTKQLDIEPTKVEDNNEQEKKIFNRFGDALIQNNKLNDETNKIINLSWKPPKIKETKVKNWVPGMPIPKENNDDSLFNASNTSIIDLDDKLYKIKEQEKELNSTIRITNLPNYIKNNELLDLFDLYGRIEEKGGIKIKEYHDSTMAFIKYVYSESAIKAIENMDGYALHHYIIKVEMAIQK